MGAWYWIGVLAGLGSAVGLLCTGLLPRRVVVAVAALLAGAIGIVTFGWAEGLGGLLGGVAGGLGAVPVVRGALRRGGTRGGLAAIVGLGALATAGLAFVPVVGYLEAVALPALGLRLRAREPERYAGLRTLARD
jgi:hypothetical protein